MQHPDKHDQQGFGQGPPLSETKALPVSRIENRDWVFWRDKSLAIERNYKARCESLLAQLEAKSLQCSQAENLLVLLDEMPGWRFALKGKTVVMSFFQKGDELSAFCNEEKLPGEKP